jgi:proline iminopeptidase
VFPAIEPFASGLLAVGNGNEIYWETSGNPHGQPAVRLHGGPGSGLSAGYRRDFDPDRFLIIGLDQRGCGRSRPLATMQNVDLATNTTPALIADLEILREHLDIETWLVTGVSWGVTLAIAYAETHPRRVSSMVLAAVTTTSAFEVEWITEQMARIFPREWDAFALAASPRPGQRLIDAYYDRITGPDPSARERAAAAWCAWEDVHVSLDPKHAPSARYADPDFRLLFATLVIHYWKHSGFASGDGLLAGVDSIGHIPATLIHGRLDVSSALEVPWRLHQRWPASELIIVDDDGHGGATMGEELVRAIDRSPR